MCIQINRTDGNDMNNKIDGENIKHYNIISKIQNGITEAA